MKSMLTWQVGPEVYAPLLAAIIPVGGVVGGVGSGLAGDWLSRRGGRAWLTVGTLCYLCLCLCLCLSLCLCLFSCLCLSLCTYARARVRVF